MMKDIKVDDIERELFLDYGVDYWTRFIRNKKVKKYYHRGIQKLKQKLKSAGWVEAEMVVENPHVLAYMDEMNINLYGMGDVRIGTLNSSRMYTKLIGT